MTPRDELCANTPSRSRFPNPSDDRQGPMRKETLRLAAAVAVCASLLFSAPPRAAGQQLAAATLRGVVTDPNGAVVPGATVKATNVATGVSRETQTNGEGAYTLSNLPPGGYEVRVEATGFSPKVSKSPVLLQVGQSVTLDTALEIGL